MFLRRNRRVVDGETYEYWTLVRTVRTARRPRQEIIATLGKEPGLESLSRQQKRPEFAPGLSSQAAFSLRKIAKKFKLGASLLNKMKISSFQM
jgi:hypothetical protein